MVVNLWAGPSETFGRYGPPQSTLISGPANAYFYLYFQRCLKEKTIKTHFKTNLIIRENNLRQIF